MATCTAHVIESGNPIVTSACESVRTSTDFPSMSKSTAEAATKSAAHPHHAATHPHHAAPQSKTLVLRPHALISSSIAEVFVSFESRYRYSLPTTFSFDAHSP